MHCCQYISTLNTDVTSCSGSLKVLECVPCLCQLSSGWLSWRGSSCLGVSKARVQEDAVFWKPVRHVCQSHHPPAQHCACTPEPPTLRPNQPGNVERANIRTQPHSRHSVIPCVQHTTSSAQELVSQSINVMTAGDQRDLHLLRPKNMRLNTLDKSGSSWLNQS